MQAKSVGEERRVFSQGEKAFLGDFISSLIEGGCQWTWTTLYGNSASGSVQTCKHVRDSMVRMFKCNQRETQRDVCAWCFFSEEQVAFREKKQQKREDARLTSQ